MELVGPTGFERTLLNPSLSNNYFVHLGQAPDLVLHSFETFWSHLRQNMAQKKPKWFHHIERPISDLVFSIIVAVTKSYISNKNKVLGAN